jgi:hypothetical protein
MGYTPGGAHGLLFSLSQNQEASHSNGPQSHTAKLLMMYKFSC